MKWSLGFVFAGDLDQVVLLRKGKTLHVGLWNGVGGKVESHETPLASMVRECREETGMSISDHLWEEVGTIGFPNGDRVHAFATWDASSSQNLPAVDASWPGFGWTTDKPILIPLNKLGIMPLAPHLEVLVYASTQKLRDPSRAAIHIQEVARF